MGDNYYSYYDSDPYFLFKKFFDYIFNQPSTKVLFFVHNLTFDGCLMIEYLSLFKYIKYETIVKNNNLYFLKLNWNNYEVSFKCSYKLLPLSLNNIAKGFNLKHVKMPYPYLAINKEKVVNNMYVPSVGDFDTIEDYELFLALYKNHTLESYTKQYCLTDVKITKEFVEIVHQLSIKESVSIITDRVYSAPGLSLKIFLAKYNKKNIDLKYNSLLDNYVRSAYYGGRCEVFGNPKNSTKLYHFDYSGMYGWCLQQKFPYGSYVFKNTNLNINTPGYYYIEYSSNMEIPVLPHHNPLNNKLMFTNGRNSGVFWFEEIQLFQQEGGIIHDVKSGVVFDNYDYCFDTFVDHFNKLRTLGGAYKVFSKFIVNSLYGKLGNKQYEVETVFITYTQYLEMLKKNVEITNVSSINNIFLVSYKVKRNQHQKFGIQFAGVITAKARVRLYKTLKEIQKNGGRLLYCDTDSYFVEYEKDVLGETHGEAYWDPNKSDTVIEDAVYIAPKMYGLKYKNHEVVKLKGIENKKITFSEMKHAFYTARATLDFQENYFNKKNLQLSFKMQNKSVNIASYDKRKFSPDKLTTSPYEIKAGLYI